MTVKTIVSTEMAAAVARKHGVTIQNVLTGFKYIGEKIKEAEETGEGTFIFGFEESYGYLKGSYARDKDGVVASMLLAEMACHYFLEGKTLLDAMEGLYEEYGFYCEHVVSIMMEGAGGLEKMERTMAALREKMPADIEGIPVRAVRDYQAGTVFDLATGQKKQTGLPKSDVVFFELGDGSSFVVRPSGTEPKIKCYMLGGGRDQDETGGKCRALEKFVRDIKP
jgi:phosphoglucomutase